MLRKIILSLILLAVSAGANSAAETGLVVTTSQHDVAQTSERAVAAISERGLKLVARIDHAAGAQAAGLELKPTLLLIFGNPKSGTPLMHCSPTIAIDLPLKLLIWEDETGTTRIAYNDPAWLDSRHGLSGCAPILKKVAAVLAAIAAEAGR